MSYYAYNPYIQHDPDYFKRNDYLTRLFNYLSSQMSSFLSTSSESKPPILAYAAGAGLAAGVLIYVFGPTFFIDGNGNGMNSAAGGGKRKQTVVGLYNPANDCFVNSVLQALAGCGELRKFLGARMRVQEEIEEAERGGFVCKGRRPALTRALKVMLDKLNERPLYRKTISTRDFIYELERVFRSRISRNQQDAQEFLQIVAQTLAEEYEAQEKIRLVLKKFEEKKKLEEKKDEGQEEEQEEGKEGEEEGKQEGSASGDDTSEESFEVVPAAEEASEEGKEAEPVDISTVESEKSTSEEPESTVTEPSTPGTSNDEEEEETSSTETDKESSKPKPKHITLDAKVKELEKEEEEKKEEEKEELKVPEFGMPMEGKLESGIQCLVCGFEPKPTGSTFVVLTLNVPVRSSVTLDDCFNEHLSTEFIDDFQCAKCKLIKTISVQEKRLATTKDEKEAAALRECLETLNHSLTTNPEEIPKDTPLLPSPKLTTVKSRIAKRTYFAHCPDVLAIHLSRSIFDYYSRKNGCKVSFPEELLLGPLLSRSKYKLLGLITHRGSHDSGHYECYRRQNSHPPPYSTPMPVMVPKVETAPLTPVTPVTVSTADTPVSQTPGASQVNLEKSGESSNGSSTPAPSVPQQDDEDEKKKNGSTTALPPAAEKTAVPTAAGKASKVDTLSLKSFPSKGKKAKAGVDSRWWRISDDSVKEVKTGDVLGLQKEVYLLFYEKVHPER
ncbi:hypothetical protein TWF481_001233 [Arthrobotrys musiformis]|uniref:Ubiquitin carboxyl-terminal hydrolase n=1 Tax=Arthrobotrys musiformis TaxID=47236 RepID=A0AAV9WS90_9PEZI